MLSKENATADSCSDFDGAALHLLPPHEIVERGLVLVPEGRHIFASMRVLENLEIGAFSARARRERHAALRWVYDIFPILKERREGLRAAERGKAFAER